MISRLKQLNLFSLAGAYVQFVTARNVIEFIVGSFFVIFIFRSTDSFELAVLGVMAYYVGIAAGYVIPMNLAHRIGYVNSYRLSFLVMALVFTYSSVFFEQVKTMPLLFSMLYGLGSGTFFSTNNLFLLGAFHRNEREPIFFLSQGIKAILGTVFPIVTGLLIVSNGYRDSFIMAAAVCYAAMLLPNRAKTPPADKFNRRNFYLMTKLMGFNTYTTYVLFTSHRGRNSKYELPISSISHFEPKRTKCGDTSWIGVFDGRYWRSFDKKQSQNKTAGIGWSYNFSSLEHLSGCTMEPICNCHQSIGVPNWRHTLYSRT